MQEECHVAAAAPACSTLRDANDLLTRDRRGVGAALFAGGRPCWWIGMAIRCRPGAVARLGTNRAAAWGRTLPFVLFGAKGKTVLTAGRDNTVRLWDLATGTSFAHLLRPDRRQCSSELVPPPLKPVRELTQADAAAKKVGEFLQKRRPSESNAAHRNKRLGRGRYSMAGRLALANGPAIHLYEVRSEASGGTFDGPASGLVGLLFSPTARRWRAAAAMARCRCG